MLSVILVTGGGACADLPRPAKRAPGTAPEPTFLTQLLEDVHRGVDQFGRQGLPKIDFAAVSRSLRLRPVNQAEAGVKGTLPLNLSPAELVDVARLAVRALEIDRLARRREAVHRGKLAERGIMELPPSTAACRYHFDVDRRSLLFDRWGECYIDRRFVTDSEMVVVHRLEAYYRKAFGAGRRRGGVSTGRVPARPETKGVGVVEVVPLAAPQIVSRVEAMKAMPIPIFRGFEDERYQEHDALILRLTAEFNAHKAAWIGGTAEQAQKVPDLAPSLVKAHMVEETGGNGPGSRAAWKIDPLQVNVPGDWDDAKLSVGLLRPVRRNEGALEQNVRAAIMFLARKGFGVSGQPAGRRAGAVFDGWTEALRRYNARRDRTLDGRFYSDAYADKIRLRAGHPDLFVPIEIRIERKEAQP